MTLDLVRVGQSERGTFGVLRLGSVPFAVTVEQPWLENMQDVSCIPAGRYRCARVNSPRFGDTFEVTGVPGRSHVLFHRGNSIHDTRGCILVAEEFGGTFGAPVIASSDKGFREFLYITSSMTFFDLVIHDVPPSTE